MTTDGSKSRVLREKAREALNSGIIRVYLIVSLVSITTIAIATGSIGTGIFIGGWIGLFATIAVNELTPGHLMDESWISRRKI